MERSPYDAHAHIKKGPWTPEEDEKLVNYIHKHGHGCWRALPKLAGLNRCGKSCRLRWTNYLRPDIKRGKFSEEEEQTILHLHSLLGNKWSTIATHLSGRTDNEIKNFWNTHLKKKLIRMGFDPVTHRLRSDHFFLSNLPHLLALAHLIIDPLENHAQVPATMLHQHLQYLQLQSSRTNQIPQNMNQFQSSFGPFQENPLLKSRIHHQQWDYFPFGLENNNNNTTTSQPLHSPDSQQLLPFMFQTPLNGEPMSQDSNFPTSSSVLSHPPPITTSDQAMAISSHENAPYSFWSELLSEDPFLRMPSLN